VAGHYNPLEAEILKRECKPLESPEHVQGAGVYLIYYRGGFQSYAPLAAVNRDTCRQPIYVGKAIPKGGRKGGMSTAEPSSGAALASRLRKHASTIRATSTLNIDDFRFRCLVLDDIWIPLGENVLIETFKPLWNVVVDGFGINDPGKGRTAQKRSPWDVLHPGRDYAARLTGGGMDLSAVIGRIEDYFAGRPLRRLPKDLGGSSIEPSDNE
jgi:Eco29kI restriction endonuclease